MGKKKNKMKNDGLATAKEQSVLIESFRDMFLNGSSDLPEAFHPMDWEDDPEEDEKQLNDFYSSLAEGLGLDISREDDKEDDEEVENEGEKGLVMVEVSQSQSLSSDDNTYDETYKSDSDEHEPGVGPAPALPSTGLIESNIASTLIGGVLSDSSIEIFKNSRDVLFFADRERGFCIDTRELEINTESQYVTSPQLKETFKFFLLNSRPDAIFMVDEFEKMVGNAFESVDEDAYVFIKDHGFIFAYHVGGYVYDAWDKVCEELRVSGKLYDFCNTFAKKCASKHYRMNHSKSYIQFWIDVQSTDNGTEFDDKKYYISLMKEDEFNEMWEEESDKEDFTLDNYDVFDYWDFYDMFRSRYFAKASSEYSQPTKPVKVEVAESVTVTEAAVVITGSENNSDEDGSVIPCNMTEDGGIKIDVGEEPDLSGSDEEFDPASMDYEPSTETNSDNVFTVHRRN